MQAGPAKLSDMTGELSEERKLMLKDLLTPN